MAENMNNKATQTHFYVPYWRAERAMGNSSPSNIRLLGITNNLAADDIRATFYNASQWKRLANIGHEMLVTAFER